MECNLRELICQKDLNLHDGDVINLSHQLLCGLEYIHSRALIHRDLKPANIGVTKVATRQWLLRILDFGNARLIAREAGMTTIKITTPCYRAPEYIYQPLEYTEKVDLWAVGCIMVEMYSKVVLFYPPVQDSRHPDSDMICEIVNLLGRPSEEIMAVIERENLYIFTAINRLKPRSNLSMEKARGIAAPAITQLIDKLVVFNYENRISASEALAAECFNQLPRQNSTDSSQVEDEHLNGEYTYEKWVGKYKFRTYITYLV
ncbi:Mitogen-activated protein kinase 11 [Cichlidogyrus casuarinus]|uniref:Mitogen-activated protein kinase 11 n=1 Tax=Cichlidogyrus casuarinus TaxID=1844966 RepID=A0ABD2PS71_9PLAT